MFVSYPIRSAIELSLESKGEFTTEFTTNQSRDHDKMQKKTNKP